LSVLKPEPNRGIRDQLKDALHKIKVRGKRGPHDFPAILNYKDRIRGRNSSPTTLQQLFVEAVHLP